MNKLEIAYFVDVVSNPEKSKIEYFDPYERSAADRKDMGILLNQWNKNGRPNSWREQMKNKEIQ